MSARSLVVGFDGFDLDVVRALGSASLPHVHRLMSRGAFSATRSVQPPATLPNWTTFLTGLDPGTHGVFDFTVRKGYRVRFLAGAAREAPTFIARLDRLGHACASIGFPGTWPPERLKHGIVVSGWDSPVAFEADRSFVWPPSLYDLLRARFGRLTFDTVNEFDADTEGWHAELPGQLCARVDHKARLGEWLLRTRPWDLFAIYFGESDTVSHYLWSLHDRASPRRPQGHAQESLSGLTRVYRALDESLGRLVEAAGAETEITVISDHGSGGSSDKVLYLNRALAEAELLTFNKTRLGFAPLAKEAALKRFPPALRERVFRFGKSVLPSWLESHARFGAIDMTRTTAFSDELNYFPAVHLNMAGREPHGTIAPERRNTAILEVEAALHALRDPWNDRPVLRRVYRREELFDGPFVERAPDLLLELNLDDGYSYNLMPSAQAPQDAGTWRQLGEHEKLGRKGRSLPGSHRPHGFAAMAGPSVESVGQVKAHISDVTATLLARHGVKVPTAASGRVLWELLDRTRGAPVALPRVQTTSAVPKAKPGIVEARLRALGYID